MIAKRSDGQSIESTCALDPFFNTEHKSVCTWPYITCMRAGYQCIHIWIRYLKAFFPTPKLRRCWIHENHSIRVNHARRPPQVCIGKYIYTDVGQ